MCQASPLPSGTNWSKRLRTRFSRVDHVAVGTAGLHPSPGRSDPDLLYRRVEAAAGRVLRAWRYGLVATVGFTLASAGLVVLILAHGGSTTPYALLWAVFTVALAYNVTRLVPRPSPAHELTVSLTPEDAARVSDRLAGVDGWRPVVRLSAYPSVHVDGDALVIGLPLWLCLRQNELGALVADARATAVSAQARSIARAFRIADGGIGRGLRGRRGRDAWASRVLVGRVDARISELIQAYQDWLDAVRACRGPDWAAAAEAADTVVEAWDFLTRRWLAPALQKGAWHAAPFSGLREFMVACEHGGLIERATIPHGDTEAVSLLADSAGYERELAELLVSSAPHEDQPISWADHPRAVTEPRWRTTLAAGLHAADWAVGRPQPATLDNLLALLEQGWDDAIAAAVVAGLPGELEEDRPPTDAVLQHLLEAAVSVALVDGRVASTTWCWPHGTELYSATGVALPVSVVVSEAVSELAASRTCRRLRTWLAEVQVDSGTPLWLAGGTGPDREEAIFAFEAYQGMRTSHVVLSDRSLRTFDRGHVRGMREGMRMQMSGAHSVLSRRLQAVEEGDLTDQHCEVPLNSIVQAHFTPLVGGHWWRLRVRTSREQLILRGNGDGREVAAWMAAALGDRLTTRWLHTHRWLLRARNAVGYGCLGIGGFGLILAGILIVNPSSGLDRTDAGVIALLSACILAIAFVPEVLAAVIRQLRQRSPQTPLSLNREQ